VSAHNDELDLGVHVVQELDRIPVPAMPPTVARGRFPFHSFIGVSLAIAAAVALVLASQLGLNESPALQPAAPALKSVLVIGTDDSAGTGSVDLINAVSGTTVGHIDLGYHPDVAVDSGRGVLYVLDSHWEAFRLGPATLRALDAATLSERWHVPLDDRFLYTLLGPSTLLVSDDGRRLVALHFHYLGPDQARYWISVHDTRNGAQLGTVELPDCGGAYLNNGGTSDPRHIYVSCTRTSDLRAVRMDTFTQDFMIQFPKESVRGFEAIGATAVAANGTYFAVLRDQRIIAVNLQSRQTTTFEELRANAPVVTPGSAMAAADGHTVWFATTNGGGSIVAFDTGSRRSRTLLAEGVQAFTLNGDAPVYVTDHSVVLPTGSVAPAIVQKASGNPIIWRIVRLS
jgi:outer membrane protein assembly factor BamB